ncbi:MAG: alpha/beta fold hydrolase [Planctomycetaceae bacterium]|nr:alpha/beta fold hydrolase [Planctomycetaceae bacterium]
MPRFLFCLLIGFALLPAIGRAAEPIQPAAELPKTSPWDLKALSEAPAVEWIDSKSPVHSLFYAGEKFHGEPTRVFAYYATPGTLAGDTPKDTRFPAVVLVHGGGGTAFREWAELWAKRGYAAIAMDLAGNRPEEMNKRSRLKDGGPDQSDDYKFGHISDPVTEHWSYHAVADVIRAHSLIRSFPEVDADRTALTGISWGGYLTCIVASLDTRFKAAVPVYGCGFLHDNSAWLNRFVTMTPENRTRWIDLYDPSKYLPACHVPIFFVNGTNDFAYPLDSYKKSYDVVPGPKNYRITVNMPHGHPQGWAPAEIGAFIDEKLLGATPLPVVRTPQLAKGSFTAAVVARTPVKSAALHYTTSTEPINKRMWSSVAAEVVDGKVTGKAPPEGTTGWFVTVTDDRNLTTSSEVLLIEKPKP